MPVRSVCEFYHLMRLDKQTCDWHNKKCDSLYVTQDISKGACQAAVNAVALIRVKIRHCSRVPGFDMDMASDHFYTTGSNRFSRGANDVWTG